MPKYLSIQVPEPCHENWDNMTAANQGRYCNACAKTVIDFSEMTDTQVLNHFKKDTGNTCGRFHHNQLENNILIPRKEIPWLKYFFTITIPAFIFSIKAVAQKKIESTKTGKIMTGVTPSNLYMGGGYQIYDSADVTNKNRMTVGEVWVKSTVPSKKDSVEKLREVVVTSSIPYTKKSCMTTGWAVSMKVNDLISKEKLSTEEIFDNIKKQLLNTKILKAEY